MKTEIPKTKQWRIDSRYSAALYIRSLRTANRFGAGYSRAAILKMARARYGW